MKSQNQMKQLMIVSSMLLFLFLLTGKSYSQQQSLQGLPNTSVFSYVSNNAAIVIQNSNPLVVEEGTLISYTFPYVSSVKLVIYDKKGKELKVIVDDIMAAPGSYSHDITTLNLRSGIYYYRLTVDDKTDVKKIKVY